jgi:hypothetical protein
MSCSRPDYVAVGCAIGSPVSFLRSLATSAFVFVTSVSSSLLSFFLSLHASFLFPIHSIETIKYLQKDIKNRKIQKIGEKK